MNRHERKGNIFARKAIMLSLVLFFFLLASSLGIYQQASALQGVSPLVETDWLANNLKRPDIRIVYVGFVKEKDKEKFDEKHIANSVYLSVKTLMDALGDGSKPPERSKFEALMGELGITRDTHVILYGAPAGNPFIPGAYWLMKYFGHEKVSILNGVFPKWNKEGRETTSEPAKVKPATYKAGSANESMRADADYVLKNLKNTKVVLVDTRSPDEYVGKEERNKRKGHIPGAINLNFYPTNRNKDGTYKSVSELKAVYESKGVTKDKEVITYCEGGVRAADTYFVLKELLGYPDVKVYVGSWGEWGNRLDPKKYPIEK
jgi:thiosulfate/3-mercaptopyruvate sulfurtransferase